MGNSGFAGNPLREPRPSADRARPDHWGRRPPRIAYRAPVRAAHARGRAGRRHPPARPGSVRSEEHTSELQSLMRSSYAVFCLKKKNKPQSINAHNSMIPPQTRYIDNLTTSHREALTFSTSTTHTHLA